jgi:hypothetical protein
MHRVQHTAKLGERMDLPGRARCVGIESAAVARVELSGIAMRNVASLLRDDGVGEAGVSQAGENVNFNIFAVDKVGCGDA